MTLLCIKALGNSVVPQQAYAALEILVPAFERSESVA